MQQNVSGIAWLLCLQAAGELLSRALALPVPGPVLGMLLLLPALSVRMVREAVGACADFLLAHLSLLFVPVSVGVIVYLPVLREGGGRLALILLLSTWSGMTVTVLTLRWLLARSGHAARA